MHSEFLNVVLLHRKYTYSYPTFNVQSSQLYAAQHMIFHFHNHIKHGIRWIMLEATLLRHSEIIPITTDAITVFFHSNLFPTIQSSFTLHGSHSLPPYGKYLPEVHLQHSQVPRKSILVIVKRVFICSNTDVVIRTMSGDATTHTPLIGSAL